MDNKILKEMQAGDAYVDNEIRKRFIRGMVLIFVFAIIMQIIVFSLFKTRFPSIWIITGSLALIIFNIRCWRRARQEVKNDRINNPHSCNTCLWAKRWINCGQCHHRDLEFELEPICGQIQTLSCKRERAFNGDCGPDGKHWIYDPQEYGGDFY